jgi:hypothetical protein
MGSSRQSLLIPVALTMLVVARAGDKPPKEESGAAVWAAPLKKKFLDDDPLWVEPKPRAVRTVKTTNIDTLYDFIEGSFVVPRHEKKQQQRQRMSAQNVNTLGEVPDSEWYTNRHALRRMTTEQLAIGPGAANPPDPSGRWHVISAKTDGVTPGFRIEDAHHNQYLLKFDPPEYPELASAADVIGSKIYYALGYNTPENYIAYFRRDQLTVSDSSSWRDRLGKKHLLTPKLIDQWLLEQPKDRNGCYRAMASRLIAGEPVGPFKFEGTRPDDPNDVVPHELRRELRGMALFAAWLNDTDAKAINTLDSLVEEDGVKHVKHYRIDWGASLGSDSLRPKDIRRGHDYLIDPKATLRQAASFGFYLPEWMRTRYPKIRGVGTFDSDSLDAANWKANYPTLPFLLMDEEDAFWAAKKIMAFSDADIRAIVETGKYTDPRSTDWVTESLIKRRDKVAQAWLSQGLALDNFRVERGRLSFDDLAALCKVGPSRQYNVQWYAYDNETNRKNAIKSNDTDWSPPKRLGETNQFVAATIHAASDGTKPVAPEVTVYLRSGPNDWTVIGIERSGK